MFDLNDTTDRLVLADYYEDQNQTDIATVLRLPGIGKNRSISNTRQPGIFLHWTDVRPLVKKRSLITHNPEMIICLMTKYHPGPNKEIYKYVCGVTETPLTTPPFDSFVEDQTRCLLMDYIILLDATKISTRTNAELCNLVDKFVKLMTSLNIFHATNPRCPTIQFSIDEHDHTLSVPELSLYYSYNNYLSRQQLQNLLRYLNPSRFLLRFLY